MAILGSLGSLMRLAGAAPAPCETVRLCYPRQRTELPAGRAIAHTAQRAPGGFEVWMEPFVCLRAPKIFNLRMDPYERADVVSDQYYDWVSKNAYLMAYGVFKTSQFLETFLEYPPSQLPGSFTVTGIAEGIDEQIRERARR